jgi:hypothetical protein
MAGVPLGERVKRDDTEKPLFDHGPAADAGPSIEGVPAWEAAISIRFPRNLARPRGALGSSRPRRSLKGLSKTSRPIAARLNATFDRRGLCGYRQRFSLYLTSLYAGNGPCPWPPHGASRGRYDLGVRQRHGEAPGIQNLKSDQSCPAPTSALSPISDKARARYPGDL